jgi:hypothetical protein
VHYAFAQTLPGLQPRHLAEQLPARQNWRRARQKGNNKAPLSGLKSEPLCDVFCDVASPESTIVPQLAALTEVMCQCDEARMNIARNATAAHHCYPHFQN